MSASSINTRIVIRFEWLSEITGIIVAFSGFLIALDWVLKFNFINSFFSNIGTIEASSAISFILVGQALWLVQRKRTNARNRRIASLCAFLAGCIAILAIIDSFSVEFAGLDGLLNKILGPSGSSSERSGMTLLTAFNFLMISSALILIVRKEDWGSLVSQILAIIAGLTSVICLAGYIHHLSHFHELTSYHRMTLPTVLLFLLIAAGTFFARSGQGVAVILTNEGVVGLFARRLFFMAVAAPLLMDIASHLGHEFGLYQEPLEPAVHSLLTMSLLIFLFVITVASLKQMESERGRLEDSLKHTASSYQDLFDNAPAMYVITQNRGMNPYITDCNKLFLNTLGYSLPEVLNQPLSRFFSSQSQTLLTGGGGYERALAGKFLEEERQLVTREGKIIDTLSKAVPRVAGDGSVVGTLAMYVDISERRSAEREFQESEERYRVLFQNSIEAIYLADPATKCLLEVNSAFLNILGYTAEEASDLRMYDFIPLSSEELDAYIESVPQSGIVELADRQWRRIDGSVIDVQINGKEIKQKGKDLLFIVGRDITAKKRAEAQLRESEERFRKLAETSPAGVLIHQGGKLNYVNPAVEKITGYPKEELLSMNFFDLAPPDLRITIRERGLASLRGEAVSSRYEHMIMTKDGQERWVDLSADTFESGGKKSVLAILTDITELKEKEILFRNLFINSPIGIYIIQNGRFVLVNSQFQNITGYGEEQLLAIEAIRLVYPEDRDQVREGAIEMLKSEKTLPSYEYRCLKNNGEIVWVMEKVASIYYQGKRAVLGSFMDATSLKTAERALLRESIVNAALADLAKALISIDSAEAISSLVLEEAKRLTGSNTGFLANIDIEGNVLFNPCFTQEVKRECRIRSKDPEFMKPKGVFQEVIENRKAMRLNSPQEYPGGIELTEGHIPVNNLLCVPSMIENKVIGLMALANSRHAYTEEDVILAEQLATLYAIAFQRNQMEEQIRSQIQYLEVVRTLTLAVSGNMELRAILHIVLDQLTALLKIHAADILLYNPHLHTLDYAAEKGFKSRALKYTRLAPGEGQAGQAALERRIIIIHNLKETIGEFAKSPLLSEEDFVTYLGVPLIAKGQIKGVLEVFHREPLLIGKEFLEILETLSAHAAIAIDNVKLFEDIQRSNLELQIAYDSTLEGWSRALDLRDRETEGHSKRVAEMTVRLASVLDIPENQLISVRRGALLHDIGKMGIPDSILLKQGPLSDQEWTTIRKHPMHAFEFISGIPYLKSALDIPCYHHERWDGKGYPEGLKGHQIPLAARIFAVVDVWDALHSDRPYRPAWTEDQVREYIKSQSGSHFDPLVVEAFLKMDW